MSTNVTALLQSSASLMVVGISEPASSVLSIIVVAAEPSETVSTENPAGLPFRQLQARPESRYFELLFDRYVLYLTVNESHGALNSNNIGTGSKLITYSQSKLLENAELFSTPYNIDGDGPLQHFELITENHLLSVLCYAAPEITLLNAAPENTNITGPVVYYREP